MKDVLFALVLICGALGASAGTAGQVKLRPYSARIASTATLPAAGLCSSGYSHFCASGACTCLAFSGTAHGNRIASGGANFQVNVDNNAEITGVVGQCLPFFAEIGVVASKDSETIDAQGIACTKGTGNNATISGGFNIAASSLSIVGWGTFTGHGTFSNSVLGSIRIDLAGREF